jgi:hypothetical protein
VRVILRRGATTAQLLGLVEPFIDVSSVAAG